MISAMMYWDHEKNEESGCTCMKLMTLNTHSLQEEHYEQKLEQFAAAISQEQPDIIAMQEVNQTIGAPAAEAKLLEGFLPVTENSSSKTAVVRTDNHAAQAAKRLRDAGVTYYWTWVPAKIGYGKYEEGLALFSKDHRIQAAEAFFISECHDFANWKTRKALGIRTDSSTDWFFTVHMGWWQDEEEPFASQWERLEGALRQKTKPQGTDGAAKVWLMGDFNSPAEFRGQGYDCIKQSGWYDTYTLAEAKDSGITVEGCIDGWRSLSEQGTMPEGMRMDQIWCSSPVLVKCSAVWFNGTNGAVVSDHFGVGIDIP